MKCPRCKAKLLPVDGEMFCLQCGTAVMGVKGADMTAPELEETTDPILQKAITDSVQHPVRFRLPVSDVKPAPPATNAFLSMRSILEGPGLVPAGEAAAVLPAPKKPSAGKVEGSKAPEGMHQVHKKSLMHEIALSWSALPRAWVAGLVVFVVFMLLNGAIYATLSQRVFPGVKVGEENLGGLTFGEAHQRITALAKPAGITVLASGVSYSANTSAASADDVLRIEDQVRQTGHNTPMPLAGLVESMLSKPLALNVHISDSLAQSTAKELAARVDTAPTGAVAMIVSGKVVLVADKAGEGVDLKQTAAAIKAAYGHSARVNAKLQQLVPLVRASDFAPDIEKAQSLLGLQLKVSVKGVAYTPTIEQIGGWLVFLGPGKGVSVDGSQVASYVTGLPGKFDRQATTVAIINAMKSGQNMNYTSATNRVTAAPTLASAAVNWPVMTYKYCMRPSPDKAAAAEFAAKVKTVLNNSSQWALGGRLKYVEADSSCNFYIGLFSDADMASLNMACSKQTTCEISNVVAVKESAWAKVAVGWTGTTEDYKTELINHEVGHWLGFQHATCLGNSAASIPILSAPDLVVPGCSPNWYAVPPEEQGTKVLPGF